jgi:isopentenyl-diphosphate delta-isomerase type 1
MGMQMQETSGPDYNSADELLAVVNERDEEIGAERRCVIHEQRMLHRAAHVLVFDNDGRLLIQQRSTLKDRYPLAWECVGGHLGPGETYEAAAVREVEEELGFRPSGVRFLCKVPACDETGQEFIEVFRTLADGLLRPDKSEIVATEWTTLEAVRTEVRTSARPYSPTFLHTLRRLGEL